MEIKNVVVIGSGTMGSGIAAHLCNADVPVTLLDLKTEISEKARERIHKSKPPLLIDKKKINLLKNDFKKKTGKEFVFYSPKMKISKYFQNKLISKEIDILGDYIFCFNKSFSEKNPNKFN